MKLMAALFLTAEKQFSFLSRHVQWLHLVRQIFRSFYNYRLTFSSSEWKTGIQTSTNLKTGTQPTRGLHNGSHEYIKLDKARQFEDKTKLPNVHIGLHHAEVAEEYRGSRMVFTLAGEDKRKGDVAQNLVNEAEVKVPVQLAAAAAIAVETHGNYYSQEPETGRLS
ncbi:hypothetical protein GGI43DRAFT_380891 [Trichoderma evansii]